PIESRRIKSNRRNSRLIAKASHVCMSSTHIGFRGGRVSQSNLGLAGLSYSPWRGSQGRAALAAETLSGLIRCTAAWAFGRKRRSALRAKFAPFAICPHFEQRIAPLPLAPYRASRLRTGRPVLTTL